MGHKVKSEDDLSEFEKNIIRFIAVNGPSRVCDIAMYLDTSSSAVARAANRLDMDWTHKDKIQADKKSEIKLHCTDKGRKLGSNLEDKADDSFSLMGMMNAIQDNEEK